MSEKSTADYLFGLFLFGTGPVFLVVALAWLINTQIFLYDSVSVEALSLIKAQSFEEELGRGAFKFRALDGTEHTKKFFTQADYERGEISSVVFPPGQPELARLNNFSELYLDNLCFALFGLILCLPYYTGMLARLLYMIFDSSDLNSAEAQFNQSLHTWSRETHSVEREWTPLE